MKTNNQTKAPMHAVGDSVDTGASQGARRATEEAPVSARPISPSIDSEVVGVAKRRRFTNADKRRIVLAAAACTKPGEIGALMRFEGACRCRRQIDPACRFPATQRDAHVIVAGRRMAVADGGSGKSRHLGQIRVGTNSPLGVG